MRKLRTLLAGVAVVGLSVAMVPAAMADDYANPVDSDPGYSAPGVTDGDNTGGSNYDKPGESNYDKPGESNYDKPGGDSGDQQESDYKWGVKVTATDPRGKDVDLKKVKYGDTLHISNSVLDFLMIDPYFYISGEKMEKPLYLPQYFDAIQPGEVKTLKHVVGCELKPGKYAVEFDTYMFAGDSRPAGQVITIDDDYANCGRHLAKTGASSALWMMVAGVTALSGVGMVAYRRFNA